MLTPWIGNDTIAYNAGDRVRLPNGKLGTVTRSSIYAHAGLIKADRSLVPYKHYVAVRVDGMRGGREARFHPFEITLRCRRKQNAGAVL